MAQQPAQRYASPQALASDIEHWLADEPVSARQESLLERASRWLRKHRTWAQAGGIAVLLVLTVSLVALWLVNDARHTAEGERDIAKKAQLAEAAQVIKTKAALLAEAAQVVKTKAALVAESKAKDSARGAVDQYVDAVEQAELLRDERFQPLRRKLLAGALAHYQSLMREGQSDANATGRMAEAMLRIAKINLASGSNQEAAQSFDSAAKLYVQYFDENPQQEVLRQRLGAIYNEIGKVNGKLGKVEEALNGYDAALKVFDQIEAGGRRVDEADCDRATIEVNRGQLYESLGNTDLAEQSFLRSMEIMQRLIPSHAADPHYQNLHASAIDQLGSFQMRMGATSLGLARYRESFAIFAELALKAPQDADSQADLATSYSNLGVAYEKLGDLALAEKNCRQAIEMRTKLTKENPNVEEFSMALSASLNNLGKLLRVRGDLPEARKAWQEAAVLREKAVAGNPQTVEFQTELADMLGDIGVVETELGNRDAALENFTRAIGIREKVVRENPLFPAHLSELAKSYRQLAQLQALLGNGAEARAVLLKAIALRETLQPVKDNDVPGNVSRGEALHALAELYAASGARDAALASYQDAIQARRAALAAKPAIAKHKHDLALSLTTLGMLQRSIQQPAESMESYKASLVLCESLAEEFPKVVAYQKLRAGNYNDIGVLHYEGGDLDTACKTIEKSLQILDELRRDRPTVWELTLETANGRNNLGVMHLQASRKDQGAALLSEAIENLEQLIKEYPQRLEFRVALANSSGNFGILKGDLGDPKTGREYLTKAREMFDQLVAERPGSVEYQAGKAGMLCNLGNLVKKDGEIEPSILLYDECLALCQGVLKQEPRHFLAREFSRNAHVGRANAYQDKKDFAKAAEDWRAAVGFDSGKHTVDIRISLANALIRSGDHAAGAKEAESVVKLPQLKGESYFFLAGTYALAAHAAKSEAALADQYFEQSLKHLQRCKELKFFDDPAERAKLGTDEDLALIKDRPEFQAFVAEVMKGAKP